MGPPVWSYADHLLAECIKLESIFNIWVITNKWLIILVNLERLINFNSELIWDTDYKYFMTPIIVKFSKSETVLGSAISS